VSTHAYIPQIFIALYVNLQADSLRKPKVADDWSSRRLRLLKPCIQILVWELNFLTEGLCSSTRQILVYSRVLDKEPFIPFSFTLVFNQSLVPRRTNVTL